MRFATLSAPKNCSLEADRTDMGSSGLRERRCKGTRRARFEMAGIAPASITSDRTVQRQGADFILGKNDESMMG